MSRKILLALLIGSSLAVSGLRAQTIKRGEYFFDADPGTGQGTPIGVTPGTTINQTLLFNVNSLTMGVHTFNFRVIDSNEHWSLFASRTFYIVSASTTTPATLLTHAEYFFDADPGTGNATPLTISSGSQQNNSFVISLNGLATGFHQLGIRYKDNVGHWSLFGNRTFYIVPPNASAHATSIVKAEYFFDTDPGTGLASPLAITSGNPQNNLFTVPLTSLSPGFHQLAIRYKDNAGHWSLFTNRTFYIIPPGNALASSTIVKAEYFFDTDPGTGLAKSLAITSANPQNNLFALDLTSLSPGFHQVCIRYADNRDHWSLFANRTLYIIPVGGTSQATSLTKAEYFVDADPGTGHGNSIAITAGSPQNNNLVLNVSTSAPGFHYVGIRYQDNLGRWSVAANHLFYILSTNPSVNSLKRIEYFIDTDPGYGLGMPLAFAPSPQINQLFTIDLTTTPSGSHTLNVRAKDENGNWSTLASAPFTVLGCVPPSAPSATGVNRCGNGTVTLSASGATGMQQYHWYKNATSDTILLIGPAYSPSLTANTTFYVSIYDPTTTCESGRTAVTAKITKLASPIISPNGSLGLCENNSVTISAPSGYLSYHWNTGATTQEITVSASGSYFVSAGNDTCSVPSDTLLLTIIPKPTKPLIQISGSATICGAGSVKLSAPSGPLGYVWSSGETTQQVIITTSGAYSVIVSENGCASDPSDPVRIKTVTAPSIPSVAVIGDTILCGTNARVILSGPVGLATYYWNNGDTTAQILVTAPGQYSLIVGTAPNCLSESSAPVSVALATGNCGGSSGGGSGGNTSNIPPSIESATIQVPTETLVTYPLAGLIRKGTAPIAWGTLRIRQAPASGAKATLDSTLLLLNYQGIVFVGIDSIGIQVCDTLNSCTQRALSIDVVGTVEAFNAVSANGDGKNDFFYLKFIDLIANAKQNKVTIVDRWVNLVFDITDYDNTTRVFNGFDNHGNRLPPGIYFYRIDFDSGRPTQTGFISLKQ